MGRKPWSNRRVVEDCRALGIATLIRSGLFSASTNSGGYRPEISRTILWTSGFAVGVTCPGLYVSGDCRLPSPHREEVELTYETNGREIEESIEIVSIPSPLSHSRRRHYFLCPGWDESPCQKRVGKLYLPPGEEFLRCRACHHLTYRSAKEHDKRVDALTRSPQELNKALNGTNRPRALLAFRAVARLMRGKNGS
jgi:hypothetical protein